MFIMQSCLISKFTGTKLAKDSLTWSLQELIHPGQLYFFIDVTQFL